MGKRLLLIAVLAVPTYLGYYLLHDPVSRAWAYYVAMGALVLAMADTLRVGIPMGAWATGVMWWIEVEAAQQTVCGAMQWGHPVHADVCVDWVGLDVYRAVAAIAIAGALTWRPNRQP